MFQPASSFIKVAFLMTRTINKERKERYLNKNFKVIVS